MAEKVSEERNLENLLLTKFSGFEKAIEKKIRTREVMWLFVLAALSFFGYREINNAVQRGLLTPAVERTIASALEGRMEAFMDEKLLPTAEKRLDEFLAKHNPPPKRAVDVLGETWAGSVETGTNILSLSYDDFMKRLAIQEQERIRLESWFGKVPRITIDDLLVGMPKRTTTRFESLIQ